MARRSRITRPAKTLISLTIVFLALVAMLAAGTIWSDAQWTPKLALDLEGGTQIILTPVAVDGEEVTGEVIDQSIAIIRQRVNASGVSEAEITSQGGGNIVVSLPGTPSEETLDLVRTPAVLDFRPVIVWSIGTPAEDPEENVEGLTPDAELDPEAILATPDGPSSYQWITEEVQREFNEVNCLDPANLTTHDRGDPNRAMVTCSDDGFSKFILGPIEIPGTNISNATSGLGATATGVTTGEWVVNLEFDGEGSRIFRGTTTRMVSLDEPRNQFAVVLDGVVITNPTVNEIIPNGQAQISGNFTRLSAATLAQQLSFGALPLSFEVQSEQQISATLGSEQLQRGLLAGALGMLLVIIYLCFQYRVLATVTVASLGVAALLTYVALTLLSWTIGFRLSLPGIAGIIVAIGFTADSFIVYFERIKDELRDGRPLTVAIDRAWARAKRTILASDAVNFLASIVLYSLAVGGVRGFAFTLGLTTLIDIVVVFLFTHPLMKLIARWRFFAQGHPASGLSPERLGVPGATRYVGRGKVTQIEAPRVDDAPAGMAADTTDDDGGSSPARPPDPVRTPARVQSPAAQSGPAAGSTPTMTIAERRAAQKAAAESEQGSEEASQR